jgi:hypothetical protein
MVLVDSEALASAIGRVAERHRREVEQEEAKAQVKPKPHPMPTKAEAWEAFAHALLDHEEPLDAEAHERFERWWHGDGNE